MRSTIPPSGVTSFGSAYQMLPPLSPFGHGMRDVVPEGAVYDSEEMEGAAGTSRAEAKMTTRTILRDSRIGCLQQPRLP